MLGRHLFTGRGLSPHICGSLDGAMLYTQKAGASYMQLTYNKIYNFETLALSSRRLKIFSREIYDFGTLSVSPPQSLKVPHFPREICVSGPLLQKSQSATFPREIFDFEKQNIYSAASGEGGTPKTKLKGSSLKIVQLTSPS